MTPSDSEAAKVGHDYFWPDFERMSREPDPKRRQSLELKCDGIAGLTMAALGLRVSAFFDGMRKMARFNEKLGATAGVEGYPTLQERRAFLEALLAKSRRQVSDGRPLRTQALYGPSSPGAARRLLADVTLLGCSRALP